MMSNWNFDNFRELRKKFSGSHEEHPILGSSGDDGSTQKTMSNRCSQKETGNGEHVSFEEPSRLPSNCGNDCTHTQSNGEGKFIIEHTLFLHAIA